MPVFPSKEWCEALVGQLHADPDCVRAGEGFSTDLAAAVLPDPGAAAEPFAVWGRVADGRLVEWRVLEDLDEIDEVGPAYQARAPLSVWRQLLARRLDPIEALATGRLLLRGDLRALVERARYDRLLWRVLARVPTDFSD